MRPQAIFITGPTAVGKTSLSIQIAQWLGAEIFSFDSRQFYRELKIGSAPPSAKELALVPHHFIADRSIKEPISAGDYERLALEALQEYFKKGRPAVFVGGSGLYMKAVCEGFDDLPKVPDRVRKHWQKVYAHQGITALQSQLADDDPRYYQEVDQQNPQRLIRALEIIETSGQPYSELRKKVKKSRSFEVIKIGLDLPREVLYHRINRRVDLMMEQGLLAECESLLPHRHENALQTVGYRELFEHLIGPLSLEDAVNKVKQNSRRYAKRQLTWFRREKDLPWFKADDLASVQDHLKPLLS